MATFVISRRLCKYMRGKLITYGETFEQRLRNYMKHSITFSAHSSIEHQ